MYITRLRKVGNNALVTCERRHAVVHNHYYKHSVEGNQRRLLKSQTAIKADVNKTNILTCYKDNKTILSFSRISRISLLMS